MSAKAKERHVVALPLTTFSSAGFSSESEHFFNGQQALEDKYIAPSSPFSTLKLTLIRTDMDVYEIFSKNQGAGQQWNLSRRGLGIDSRTGEEFGGAVFLEVLNNKATLPDVDNLLSSTIRKNTQYQ